MLIGKGVLNRTPCYKSNSGWLLLYIAVTFGRPWRIMRGTFFCVVFIVIDYNRWLQKHKITKFTAFVRVREEELMYGFERSRKGETSAKSNKCKQEGRESNFWSFCDNSIIECLLRYVTYKLALIKYLRLGLHK